MNPSPKRKIAATENHRKYALKPGAPAAQIHLKTPVKLQPSFLQRVTAVELLENFCCQTPDIFLFSTAIAPCGARADTIRLVAHRCRKENKQTINNKQHRRNQMKFNKWTLGLAAVGVVSLASAARADEKVSQLNTALSNPTLSGYVDVGAQYNSAGGAAY